jgi:hypothetical protein
MIATAAMFQKLCLRFRCTPRSKPRSRIQGHARADHRCAWRPCFATLVPAGLPRKRGEMKSAVAERAQSLTRSS